MRILSTRPNCGVATVHARAPGFAQALCPCGPIVWDLNTPTLHLSGTPTRYHDIILGSRWPNFSKILVRTMQGIDCKRTALDRESSCVDFRHANPLYSQRIPIASLYGSTELLSVNSSIGSRLEQPPSELSDGPSAPPLRRAHRSFKTKGILSMLQWLRLKIL